MWLHSLPRVLPSGVIFCCRDASDSFSNRLTVEAASCSQMLRKSAMEWNMTVHFMIENNKKNYKGANTFAVVE